VPATGTTAADWTLLDQVRCALRAARIRRVLALFYDDPTFRAAYEDCPPAPSAITRSSAVCFDTRWRSPASGAPRRCPRAPIPSLVFAGALLHDIGKLEAYQWRSGLFELTEPGALLGHVTLGMLMLGRQLAAQAVPPCSGREVVILQHLIASHHGALEFGAPVRPMTLEAEVLHHADHASARTTSMADALATSEHFTSGDLLSSRSLWQLDHRRVYRGTSDWGREGAPTTGSGAKKKERPPSRG
jgi:3'-5' exoribonuclease